ncbi:MAG: hypothetical protein JO362_22020 [Streptomycetaceae bacterium]|nr:hypothetical protein [Streptomycetaceae bacterium]
MTRTATTAPSPLDIITAAAAAIAVRGYYQPLSRMWESAVPTVMDVEHYLNGTAMDRGIRPRMDAAQAEAAATAAAVLQWARDGESGNEYRAKLAALARAEHATGRDLSILCSAVVAWQRDQQRAHRAAERADEAAHSRHQGAIGERLTAAVTVDAVVKLPERHYGYRTQQRHMIKLRDEDRNVFVWFSSTATIPSEGDRLTVTGTVSKHDTYRETAQTYLTRCRWTKAD